MLELDYVLDEMLMRCTMAMIPYNKHTCMIGLMFDALWCIMRCDVL